MPAADGYRRAREAAEKALALDPELVDAHLAMGRIQQIYDWDWEAADTSYRRALALEPGNAEALRYGGRLALTLGRSNEAIDLANKAIERDPLRPNSYNNLGRALQAVNRDTDAEAAFRKALELDPDGALRHYAIGLALLLQGKTDAALQEMQQETEETWRLSGLPLVFHALGRRGESDAALAALKSKYAGDSAYQIAEAHGFRGEADLAFEWLERAYNQRDGGVFADQGRPISARACRRSALQGVSEEAEAARVIGQRVAQRERSSVRFRKISNRARDVCSWPRLCENAEPILRERDSDQFGSAIRTETHRRLRERRAYSSFAAAPDVFTQPRPIPAASGFLFLRERAGPFCFVVAPWLHRWQESRENSRRGPVQQPRQIMHLCAHSGRLCARTGTENPRVGGSIPPLATTPNFLKRMGFPASPADYRRRGGRKSADHRTYMDAARFGRCLLREGIEVRLQSYIRPTSAELRSAWP